MKTTINTHIASEAIGWSLSGHAQQRMREMGVDRAEVLETVTSPEICYPAGTGSDGSDRRIAVAGRIAAVFSPYNKTVITVLWHGAKGRRQGVAA